MKENKQQKKKAMPSAYAILFIIIAAVAVLTWIIPAGSYETSEAGNLIPGTYSAIEQSQQGL